VTHDGRSTQPRSSHDPDQPQSEHDEDRLEEARIAVEPCRIVTRREALAQIVEQHHTVAEHRGAHDVRDEARIVVVAERAIGEQSAARGEQDATGPQPLFEQRALAVRVARQREHEVVVGHAQRPFIRRIVGFKTQGVHVLQQRVRTSRGQRNSLRHGQVAVERLDLFDLFLRFVVRVRIALVGIAHALRQRLVVEPRLAHFASFELDRRQ
jgi:hypothetical protein